MHLIIVLAIVAVAYWFFMGGEDLAKRKPKADPAAAAVTKPHGTPIIAGAPTPLGGGKPQRPPASAVRRPIDRAEALRDMARQRSGDIE
jgi:hypothetical protein